MHFRLIGFVVLVMPHVFAGSSSSKFSVNEPVIDFAKKGNLQRVQELIESGANINNADGSFRRVHQFCGRGDQKYYSNEHSESRRPF